MLNGEVTVSPDEREVITAMFSLVRDAVRRGEGLTVEDVLTEVRFNLPYSDTRDEVGAEIAPEEARAVLEATAAKFGLDGMTVVG